MPTELHLYDFDGTLFRSPDKPEGYDGGWWGIARCSSCGQSTVTSERRPRHGRSAVAPPCGGTVMAAKAVPD